MLQRSNATRVPPHARNFEVVFDAPHRTRNNQMLDKTVKEQRDATMCGCLKAKGAKSRPTNVSGAVQLSNQELEPRKAGADFSSVHSDSVTVPSNNARMSMAKRDIRKSSR
ncbi:hypothetical protein KP509_28G064900 [Ceratopteris richardii]|uniref:Uncharacterized protein n=1 Tax=Ceratopteris richardii TaxID=49495 RepID=A0A8T2RD41_CERRI|nr:hypothetical protein KP509_28G064900 [Ceratopteris richardii]